MASEAAVKVAAEIGLSLDDDQSTRHWNDRIVEAIDAFAAEATSPILSKLDVVTAERDEAREREIRLWQDRYDALSVTSRDGLLSSEWVLRTWKAERKCAAAETALAAMTADRDAAAKERDEARALAGLKRLDIQRDLSWMKLDDAVNHYVCAMDSWFRTLDERDSALASFNAARAAWKELEGTRRDSDYEHIAEEKLRALLGDRDGK